VALHLIEDERLVKAFAVLGVAIPNRKALSENILDEEYERVLKLMVAMLDGVKWVAICTDGWKKKHAGGGVPMVNIVVLLPHKGSIFFKVKYGGDCKKDTDSVVDFHEKAKTEVEAFFNVKVTGFVMDNTAANVAAMKILEVRNPGVVAVGCIAHALSLYFKDVTKDKKRDGMTVPWMATLYKKVMQICDTINGCGGLLALYTRVQAEHMEPKERKKLPVHIPTRFAIVHMMSVILLEQKTVLMLLPSQDEWEGATKYIDTDRKTALKKNVISEAFWKHLAMACKYQQPVYEAIARLEGDHPGLAQVFPIMMELKQHIKAVERDEHTPPSLKGVARVFNARFDKHVTPSMFAAYFLDPVNAYPSGGGYKLKKLEEAPYMLAAEDYIFQELGCVEGEDDDEAEVERKAVVKSAVMRELQELVFYPMPTRMGTFALAIQARRKEKKSLAGSRAEFWDEAVAKYHFPLVSSVAIPLMVMHASSCAAERNWSIFGNVFGEKRSRLDVQRGEKIVFIRQNSKQIESTPV
jgi:hypothetical protein